MRATDQGVRSCFLPPSPESILILSYIPPPLNIYSIVKRPMDLSTAMKKLRGGDYPTLHELRVSMLRVLAGPLTRLVCIACMDGCIK